MDLALEQTGVVAIGFGAYYGLVIDSYLYEGEEGYSRPPGDKFKAFMRFLVVIGLMAPGIALHLILAHAIKDQVALLIFSMVIPLFFSHFLPFAFRDPVSCRLGILDPADPEEQKPIIEPKVSISDSDDF